MNFLFRTDSGPNIGIGHIMRCLGLAQSLKQNSHNITFLSKRFPQNFTEHIQNTAITREELSSPASGSKSDAEQTRLVAKRLGINWIILDGYQFSLEYQQKIKSQEWNLLVLDDFSQLDGYCSKLILDQNPGSHSFYSSKLQEGTRLLQGPNFALIRREFLQNHKITNSDQNNYSYRILITFGGGAHEKKYASVLDAITKSDWKLDKTEISVTGSFDSTFKSTFKSQSNKSVSLKFLGNVKNMANVMDGMDLAISGGGSTCWELSYMGIPSFIVILSKNQKYIATELAERGFGINLGWYYKINWNTLPEKLQTLLRKKKKRAEMAKAGRNIIDGQGPQRVYQAMRSID